MTGPEAAAIIRRLGLSQARFARLTGQHVMTVSKWSRDLSPPGGASVTLLRLLEQRPELIGVLEELEES